MIWSRPTWTNGIQETGEIFCVACGIRKESVEGTPAVYKEVKLKDLPLFMELNEEEQAESG